MEPVERAVSLLPWWVGWAPVATVCVFSAVSTIVGVVPSMAMLRRPLRRLPDGVHWSEKARVAWAVRLGIVVLPALVAVVMAFSTIVVEGPLSAIGLVGHMVVAAALSLFVGLYAASRMIRGLGLPRTSKVTGRLAWILCLRPWLFPLLAMLLFAGFELDLRAVIVLAVGIPTTILLGTGILVRLLERLKLTEPADERLIRICDRAGHPEPPRVSVLPVAMANAFALPWMGHILVTKGALSALDDEQLETVIAHEMAHLDEPMTWKLARLGPITAVATLGATMPIVGTFGPLTGLAILAGVLLIVVVAARLFRRLEERADEAGSAQQGGQVYAGALARIYEVNLIPAVMGRRRVHPHLYDRLAAAGVEPDFPRPDPPPAGRRLMASLVAVGLALATMLTLRVGLIAFDVFAGPAVDDTVAYLVGGDEDLISHLAYEAFERGDGELAEALWVVCADEWPEGGFCAVSLSIALSGAYRCEEARDWLENAQSWGVGSDLENQGMRALDSCHFRRTNPR